MHHDLSDVENLASNVVIIVIGRMERLAGYVEMECCRGARDWQLVYVSAYIMALYGGIAQ